MGYAKIINAKPQIVIVPEFYDFGDIAQSGGIVSTDFIVKNIGSAALKFNRVSTSCGCTVAEIDQSDIAAGEARKMKVTFDPAAHPDQTGFVERVVYLQTNDAERPEVEIEIRANIIK